MQNIISNDNARCRDNPGGLPSPAGVNIRTPVSPPNAPSYPILSGGSERRAATQKLDFLDPVGEPRLRRSKSVEASCPIIKRSSDVKRKSLELYRYNDAGDAGYGGRRVTADKLSKNNAHASRAGTIPPAPADGADLIGRRVARAIGTGKFVWEALDDNLPGSTATTASLIEGPKWSETELDRTENKAGSAQEIDAPPAQGFPSDTLPDAVIKNTSGLVARIKSLCDLDTNKEKWHQFEMGMAYVVNPAVQSELKVAVLAALISQLHELARFTFADFGALPSKLEFRALPPRQSIDGVQHSIEDTIRELHHLLEQLPDAAGRRLKISLCLQIQYLQMLNIIG
ncbi:MAG: hypothetical protein JWQ23_4159 [Herminiimonas sp.]|nr:hypothetical protein [Herminiimonas sp.]